MKENRIVFLSVPESLRGQLLKQVQLEGESRSLAGFSIEPDIPVPVEIPPPPPGCGTEEPLSIEELSWEMILAGMLRVIETGEEKPEWINYYRNFVLAIRPGIFAEFSEAAIIKAHNGDFGKALEIFNTLRGLFPPPSRHSVLIDLNRAMVLEQNAAQLLRLGKPEAQAVCLAAEKAYRDLMEIDPPLPDAYYNGGYFFLSQKNYSQAAECFSGYLENARETTLQNAHPADAAQNDDKRKRAKKIIKEIRDKGLDDESFIEAYALIQQSKAAQALPLIHDFLERQPAVWNGWFLLGWALRLLNRWKDGEAAFRKTVELGGANSDTRNELAICLMESGDFSGSRKELETALREDPENIKIISNLGVLAMKRGRKEEAAAFFRTVLELSGDDPIAKTFLEKSEKRP